ncbi:MAG: hypothetical protein FJW20_04135 [Acidimicrobiia bacterium]|nr:hypothetical protein [Acidimicrobiia bacterium]
MFSLAKQFLGHVIPGVIKPLRVLWNEVIGFVFIAFGVVAGFSTYRHLSRFQGDIEGLMMLILGGGFVLMMLGFGVHSFWRARKINRS